MNLGCYLLDVIYPRQNTCLFCGKNLLFPEINGLCNSCLKKINFIEDYCNTCGRNISNPSCICEFCINKDWYFKKARGIAKYRGIIKDIILQFKYFNRQELIKPLGHLLYRYFNFYYGDLDIDYIIPIPLHKKREEIRGYNQSKLLADELAKHTEISVIDSLIRSKESPPLYNLNWIERKKVIKGVFRLKRNIDLRGKSIILIDDIFTSGATVNEASSILTSIAGVSNVYVLTLATYSIVKG